MSTYINYLLDAFFLLIAATPPLAIVFALIRYLGRAKVDRLLLWPTFGCLAAVFVMTLIDKLPESSGFLTVFVFFLWYVIAAIALLTTATYFVAKKRLRTAASLVVALTAAIVLWSPIGWAADFAHLGLTVFFGIGQIGPSKRSADGFIAYDWSIGGAIGPIIYLIRDNTDDIALPTDRHQHPLNPEGTYTEDGCAGNVSHLMGHYYICEID